LSTQCRGKRPHYSQNDTPLTAFFSTTTWASCHRKG